MRRKQYFFLFNFLSYVNNYRAGIKSVQKLAEDTNLVAVKPDADSVAVDFHYFTVVVLPVSVGGLDHRRKTKSSINDKKGVGT